MLEMFVRLMDKTHGRDGYSERHSLLLLLLSELGLAIKIDLGACWGSGWCGFFSSLSPEISTPMKRKRRSAAQTLRV
jgi:hypothetical protein